MRWFLLVFLLLTLPAAVAKITITAPAEAKQGEQFQLSAAVLTDEGLPALGANVTFLGEAVFGEYVIAEARTDKNGVATISHTLPYPGTTTLRARAQDMQEGSSASMMILENPEKAPAPLPPDQLPPAVKGVVVALLLGVWGVYAFVVRQIWMIRREGMQR